MSSLQLVFLAVSALTLFGAFMVVSTRNMIHAALWLVLTLMGVAVEMALLETRFFAVVQVLVYIGAIAILIIVGVMLTRRVMEDLGPQVNRSWWVAAVASAALLVGLVATMSTWGGFQTATRTVQEGGEDIAAFGRALVDPAGFLIPFEVASILLVAAMVGAIFLAGPKKED